MTSFTTVALETLESRMLYSTTPSATIVADEKAIQFDKDQINVDLSAGYQTSDADNLKLSQDEFTQLGQVSALRLKLADDTEADKTALLTDNIDGLTERVADRSVVTQDFKSIQADRSDPAAEANDALLLSAAQQKLSTDKTAAAAKYSMDQGTFKSELLQDKLNILTVKVNTDPTVMNDKVKILTDKLASQETVSGDRQQLLKDELQLAKDKAAGA
jgi:hypothetical protein